MNRNICNTHHVHDVDELKQRLTNLDLTWLGTKCHRWRNGWVAQTSLGVFLCQEGHFEHL